MRYLYFLDLSELHILSLSLLNGELQALNLNPLLESPCNFSQYEFIFERFQLVITDFALQLMVVSISHSHSLV